MKFYLRLILIGLALFLVAWRAGDISSADHQAAAPATDVLPTVEDRTQLQNEQYRFRPEAETVAAFNPAQGLYADFDAAGFSVYDSSGEWTWNWQTIGVGREEVFITAETATPLAEVCDEQMGAGVDGACLTVLTYERAYFREWYGNRPEGLEQGFQIERRPVGDGLLIIKGAMESDLTGRMADDGSGVIFALEGRDILRYHGLFVTDAGGDVIPGWMEYEDGRLYLVVDDFAAAYPLTVDPGLSWEPSWTGTSIQEGDGYGGALASAGDVNGDGYDEIMIGASNYDAPGINSAGAAFVYYGSASGLPSSPSWSAYGTIAYRAFGRTVSTAGDVNNDGYDDVLVGQPDYKVDSNNDMVGAVFLYLGSASGLASSAAWIKIGTGPYCFFGEQMGSAGDVNGDGYGDIIVSEHLGIYYYGAVYIYKGGAAGLDYNPIWSIGGGVIQDHLGIGVAGAGDVNGDGYDDVIVGEDGYDGGQTDEGRVLAFYGAPGGPSTTPSWTYEPNNSENFGRSVAGHCNVNGDSYDDVIVGAPLYSHDQSQEGRAYVFLGSATGLASSPVWTMEPNYAQTEYGTEVFCAGDVNHDGYDDIMITGPKYYGGYDWGEVELFQGGPGGPSGTPSWRLRGDAMDEHLPSALAAAGDVDGDSNDDVILSKHASGVTTVMLYLGGCKNGCAYNNVCYDWGVTRPDNVCLICSGTSWVANDGVSCNDGAYCNGADHCGSGTCSVHAGDPCPNDGFFCNGTESCNETSDNCNHTGNPCTDDGLWCNGTESCNETTDQCVHQYNEGSPRCADDGLWCTGAESCNETADQCEHQYGTGNPRCPDDGLWCNGAESCNDTTDQCQSAGTPCPNDGLWCNGAESCNETSDQCEHQYGTGNPRCPDDGLWCNGAESCNDTTDQCQSAGTPCPNDGLWCNGAESCNETTDQCEHQYGADNPRCPDDGQWCNGDESCYEAGDQCIHSGTPCPDNGLFCDGMETCDEDHERCLSSGNPCGDDGLWCNGLESCNETADECDHQYNEGAPRCPDDGLWCDGTEWCDDVLNICTHTLSPCSDDGLFCNGGEICNEASDVCEHVGNPCPNDGLYCNGVESCDETDDECVHPGNPCPDGLFCNGIETCDETNDQCFPGMVPCPDDGLWCNGTETCNESTDQCGHINNPCVDDGQWCNGAEICNEISDVCQHAGDPCGDDGLFCNGAESCNESADQCVHAGDPCGDDGLYCNGNETCNEANDQCGHAGNPCGDDGLYCNGNETCNEANDQCEHSGDPCMDDGLWCDGAESCSEEADQCQHEFGLDDPRCPDDGQFCTGVESCDETNNACVASGDPCDPDTQECNENTNACDPLPDDDTTPDDDTVDDDTTPDDDTVDDDSVDDDTTDDDAADDDTTPTDDDTVDDDSVDDDTTDDDAADDDAADDDAADDDAADDDTTPTDDDTVNDDLDDDDLDDDDTLPHDDDQDDDGGSDDDGGGSDGGGGMCG